VRAALAREAVTLPPGTPVKVGLEVTNTLEVIDAGHGLGFTAEPALLPLFPEGTGRITLELTASRHFPAGRYDLPVELRSAADPARGLVELLPVDVPPEPGATLTVLPAVGTGRKRTSFSVVADNTGNVALDLRLAATDPDHAVRIRFAEPVLRVGPGETAETTLTATCRRRLLGTDLSRQITVVATSADVEVDTRAVFRHRPLIPRGFKTVLVLAAIVAVWAGIFLFALDKALANDPLTKVAPASFYAAAPPGDHARLDALGGERDYGLAAADGSAPVGAVPKSGVVIGVGGTVSGTVEAKSTGAGIGRITVEAVRLSTHGPVLVSSAATASDGTYSIVGLLPGGYRLRFSSAGYTTVWYPDAGSEAAARPVEVTALGQTQGVDATIAGDTGSISGTVETGETPAPPVTVTVEPGEGSATRPIATIVTDSTGHYRIPDLPTPDIYDLSFTASGYQVGTDNEELTGGQQEIANTVSLQAADGTLSGTVTDGSRPVGGVSITATANGQTYTSATPTTGTVGQFTLANLPTPATYLLTFTKTGYGTRTVAEDLGPGQSLASVQVSLSGGAGDLDGQVTLLSATGKGAGGALVTVHGGATTVTTQSLTAGDVGGYQVSGLPTPGTYTVTFSLAGYEPQTIRVPLGSSGSASGIDVALQPSTATLVGSVSGSSGPLAGVTVSVTNGQTVVTSTTSSSPAGGYTFPGLAAGSYSVTFTVVGYTNQTVTVVLKPGEITPAVDVRLHPSSTGT
jgi:hypothetical protein